MRLPRKLNKYDTTTRLPVNKCIYCGAQAGPGVRLSDEHATPLGLNGMLILSKASCEVCRKITHKFEEKCLRVNFLKFRTRHLMRTRRKKQRPTHFPLIVKKEGKEDRISIPAGEYPPILYMPLFLPPGICLGRPKGAVGIAYKMHAFVDTLLVNNAASAYGEGFRDETQFAIPEFARMLAKIAYCWAYQHLGEENMRPIILGLILGTEPDFGYFIGNNAELEPHEDANLNAMHRNFIGYTSINDKIMVDVRVRLFARFGAPEYTVVVGEFIPTEAFLTKHGLVVEGANLIRVRSPQT